MALLARVGSSLPVPPGRRTGQPAQRKAREMSEMTALRQQARRRVHQAARARRGAIAG